MTVRSGGSSSFLLGIDNQGSLSMEHFEFSLGLLHSEAARLGRANPFPRTFVLADLNQPVPKGYGLEPGLSNVRIEDALIIPNSGFAKDSRDGRRLPAARLVKGDSYWLKVTDPGFQNGKIKDVEVTLYFRIDNNCTIETYYRSPGGMKLGDSVDFELKDKPFWKEHRFRVRDAKFGAEQGADIRIKVEGKSPLLAMVVIAAPTIQE